MTTKRTIRIERDGPLALLTFARPPVNAIDLDVLRAADQELEDIGRQDHVRALVVTGMGSAFSAGLDLKTVPAYSKDKQRELMRTLNRVVTRLYGLSIPTVAAVNGHAIAGGLVLVLACDYRVCTAAPCRIGLTEARAGIPFPVAPMAIVAAELSPQVARRMTLVAQNITPEQALRDGVVDELQPPERVGERAREMARELGGIPAGAYSRIKRQLRAAVLERLEPLVAAGRDPLLDAWLDAETPSAANELLRHGGRDSGH
jgi:enoyl-CoA hydratase/carnithine racemase